MLRKSTIALMAGVASLFGALGVPTSSASASAYEVTLSDFVVFDSQLSLGFAFSTNQAVTVTFLMAAAASWINWGFGLVVGAVLAREIAKLFGADGVMMAGNFPQ